MGVLRTAEASAKVGEQKKVFINVVVVRKRLGILALGLGPPNLGRDGDNERLTAARRRGSRREMDDRGKAFSKKCRVIVYWP